MTTDLWSTAAMNHLEESERLKMERKLLKPQVERRRRERMNRSLESLRTLLLHGPEAASQRRVEKSEILEHTVLFLRSSTTQATKNQPPDDGPEGKQLMDGFSACLHRAAHFLQTEGEARGLQGSLSTSLYQHLSRPHLPTAITAPTWAGISPRTKVLEKKCQRPVGCAQGPESARKRGHLSPPYTVPLRHTHPNSSLANTHAASQPTSRQQGDVRQCVWRPWP